MFVKYNSYPCVKQQRSPIQSTVLNVKSISGHWNFFDNNAPSIHHFKPPMLRITNTSVLILTQKKRPYNEWAHCCVDRMTRPNICFISFVETLHNAPKASPTLICISCAELRRMKALTSQGCSRKGTVGTRDQSHSSALNAHCKKPSQVSTQPIENVWFSLQRSTLWVQTVNPTIYDND